MLPPEMTVTVRVPTVVVRPAPRGGVKVRGSLGPRSFSALIREVPGRMIYARNEHGERVGKGRSYADDAVDVHKCLAELLLWVATAEVEGRMWTLARQTYPGRG